MRIPFTHTPQSKGPAYKSSSLVEKTLLRASYRWEQYKFSIGSTERAKAFGNVEQQLDRLAKLLVENDETAEIRALAVQSWSRNNNFWRHAQAAYNLISRSWCCTCQADHCADLALLQHSTVPVHLDVDFLFSQDADTTDGYPWRRLTTRISKDDRKLSAAVNTAIGPGKLALNTKPQFTNCPMFQKVSHSNPPDVLPRIADLCYEMSGLSRDDCWLGLLADQYCADQYCVFVSKRPTNLSNNGRFVSLEALLIAPQSKPDRKERYEMAMTIASSHLQLHSSSWLEGGWSNRDIYFAMENGKPRFGQPYLRRSFAAASSITTLPAFDLTFATLALVLIELCFGKILADTPYRAKHLSPNGSTNSVQDREAAWEWAKDVVRESGQEYFNAVQWCLEKWRVREDDPRWRAEFHSSVVEVLETIYKKTWPG